MDGVARMFPSIPASLSVSSPLGERVPPAPSTDSLGNTWHLPLPPGSRLMVHQDRGEAELQDPSGRCRTLIRFAPPLGHDGRQLSRRDEDLLKVLTFARRHLVSPAMRSHDWPLVAELTLDGDVLRTGALPLGRLNPIDASTVEPLSDTAHELRRLSRQRPCPVAAALHDWPRSPDLQGLETARAGATPRRASRYDETYVFQLSPHAAALPGLVAKHPHSTRCFAVSATGDPKEIEVPGYQPSVVPSWRRSVRFTVVGDAYRTEGRTALGLAGRTGTELANALAEAARHIAHRSRASHPIIPSRVSVLGAYLGQDPFLPPDGRPSPDRSTPLTFPSHTAPLPEPLPPDPPSHFGEALLSGLSVQFGTQEISVSVRRGGVLVQTPARSDASSSQPGSATSPTAHPDRVGRKRVRGPDGEHHHQAMGGTELVYWDENHRLRRRDKYPDQVHGLIRHDDQRPQALVDWLHEHAATPFDGSSNRHSDGDGDGDGDTRAEPRQQNTQPMATRAAAKAAASEDRRLSPRIGASAVPGEPPENAAGPSRLVEHPLPFGEVSLTLTTLRQMGLLGWGRATEALHEPSAFLRLRFYPNALMAFMSAGPPGPRLEGMRLIKQMLRNEVPARQICHPAGREFDRPGGLTSQLLQAIDLAVSADLKVHPDVWTALCEGQRPSRP